jgi:hypothetical protein
MSGSYTVTLKIDGGAEDQRSVTLGPDESTTISFDAPTSERGTYSVEIEGLTGSYEVRGGIPGFTIESVLIGLMLGVFIIWMSRRR